MTDKKYIPTSYLQFIERNVSVPIGIDTAEIKKIRILQQWFTLSGTMSENQLNCGEWRDIPLGNIND